MIFFYFRYRLPQSLIKLFSECQTAYLKNTVWYSYVKVKVLLFFNDLSTILKLQIKSGTCLCLVKLHKLFNGKVFYLRSVCTYCSNMNQRPSVAFICSLIFERHVKHNETTKKSVILYILYYMT